MAYSIVVTCRTAWGGRKVRDTGPGIKPEFLPYVFDPFRQADRGAVAAREGLGLGLAIVRNLVQLHGGTIRVGNSEGGGAEFGVDIPATEVSLTGSELEINENDLPRLDGIHVLFVDDHEDTRTLVARILSDSGAQVKVAQSAAQALLEIQKQLPDVLLSDLSMPGDDGYELLRKVRATRAAAGNGVPAVALTALVSEDQRQRAMEAGFQEFVGKPVDRARLISILANISRK